MRRRQKLTAAEAVTIAERIYTDLVDAARNFSDGTVANARYTQRCELAYKEADRYGVRPVVSAILKPKTTRQTRPEITDHVAGGVLRPSILHNGAVLCGTVPYLVAVLEGFAPEFKRGRMESKYAPLADGQTRKVWVTEWGHRTEEGFERAFRAYARNHKLKAHVAKSGQGHVIVQTERRSH